MIENRMIGKGHTRQGGHAGAMGESHGDLFGMEYVNSNGFVPVAGENRYAVGVYDTGNKSARDPKLRDELADRRAVSRSRASSS